MGRVVGMRNRVKSRAEWDEREADAALIALETLSIHEKKRQVGGNDGIEAPSYEDVDLPSSSILNTDNSLTSVDRKWRNLGFQMRRGTGRSQATPDAKTLLEECRPKDKEYWNVGDDGVVTTEEFYQTHETGSICVRIFGSLVFLWNAVFICMLTVYVFQQASNPFSLENIFETVLDFFKVGGSHLLAFGVGEG
uniref:Uncharacterized protein n=1 Tax=Mucochytrium quahogii TaxID=96639 RepID=A0A7S2SNP6_9STRA|mmetsp:Transcript_33282/g.53650  ORF Transcript_33282/g.53650 Transcript_33282/m.53650 type:complete len:194 (+) Transcript_33282:1197-1778(+)